MSSCRVQGCDKFERKRGLRGGTVADDCDYKAGGLVRKRNRNAFRVPADSLAKNYSSGPPNLKWAPNPAVFAAAFSSLADLGSRAKRPGVLSLHRRPLVTFRQVFFTHSSYRDLFWLQFRTNEYQIHSILLITSRYLRPYFVPGLRLRQIIRRQITDLVVFCPLSNCLKIPALVLCIEVYERLRSCDPNLSKNTSVGSTHQLLPKHIETVAWESFQYLARHD